jgi:oxygen-independent coproporphyrinogen-3 oxidase
MIPYLEALFREMETYSNGKNEYEISTIFMGGGTPTLFDGHSLKRVLDKCRECFSIRQGAEITVECNPGTADREKLGILADAGFNRLSIGLQAWQDQHLEYLGRIHRRRHFIDTVRWAREAGFVNISADVIFGIPGQTLEEWLETLRETVSSGVVHLSAYSLKIEEGTVFHRWKSSGRLQEMEEEQERELYHKGIELLEQLGLKQYEISNFARKGFACRHNLIYWENGEYIGCGSGAHSHMDSVRRANTKEIGGYIQRIGSGSPATEFREEIDEQTELFETLMLGFRLKEGINKRNFFDRYGFDLSGRYPNELKMLKEKGFIEEDEEAFRPTSLGFDFENAIALAFLE